MPSIKVLEINKKRRIKMIERLCGIIRMTPPNNEDSGLLFDSGATVPTDGTAGYQTGCLFQHTDGSTGTALYQNEGTNTSCDFNAVAAITAAQEALLGATAGTVAASKAVIVDASSDITGFRHITATGTVQAEQITSTDDATVAGKVTVGEEIQLTAGAATAAVALRLGDTATEGLEIKVYDGLTSLTNAVSTDTACVIPAGAVILSVQGNLAKAVTGDASGDDLLAKIGIGISGGDEDAYAEFAALTKNTKANGIPDWAVLAAETTIAIFALKADGNTACTEKFTANADAVRVRVVYAVCNSLDDAA
jgi:hypothetical protein